MTISQKIWLVLKNLRQRQALTKNANPIQFDFTSNVIGEGFVNAGEKRRIIRKLEEKQIIRIIAPVEDPDIVTNIDPLERTNTTLVELLPKFWSRYVYYFSLNALVSVKGIFSSKKLLFIVFGGIVIVVLLALGFTFSGVQIGPINLNSPSSPSGVSVFDVQYELADENGSVIHRRSWQENQLLMADARNITRMILSIKLSNPSSERVYAVVKNEQEISDMPYVVDSEGDFKNEEYPVPPNGNTGFVFGIDITPFTQLTLISTSATNTQEINIFDEEGNYVETVKSNIIRTYGMYIPYKIGVLDKNKKLIDIFEFKILCRASIGELKATFDDRIDGADGRISKSLNFECHPTS